MSISIVHACAYFAPAFVYGGPPRTILELCRAQREWGIDVRVVTTTANGDRELDDRAVDEGSYEGIPVAYCRRAWPRSIFHAPSVGAAVRQALQEADVLHIHGLWNATVWSAAAAARQARRPYVLSPRGMLAPAALAHDAWRKRLAYVITDHRVIRDASLLHATSMTELHELTRRGGPRAVYVPNGVTLPDENSVDPAAGRARFHLPAGAPIVLFLGRIHPIKRLDLLAEAFAYVRARHPDTHLVIAGPDEGGHRGAVAPLFDLFGDAVTWTGRVDDTAKQELLAAASVLVLCSNSESFGMSAAEAMAAARPVVVTRTCPWPDVESHGAGFWVEQSGPAIGDAIVRILADPSAARAMGCRGRAVIANRYSWRQVAASLLREYETIGSRAARIA